MINTICVSRRNVRLTHTLLIVFQGGLVVGGITTPLALVVGIMARRKLQQMVTFSQLLPRNLTYFVSYFKFVS
jgi:hypothetical protein